MRDSAKLHLAVHNSVYRNMLQDNAWTQESLVGIAIAQQARETGKLAKSFNFQPVWDQQMPSASGTIIYGQVLPAASSATVTGTATAFTTDLTAGVSYLTFGCDATATQYLVSAIATDTSLTLSTTYSGVVPATATTARRITNSVGTVAATTASGTITGTSTLFTTALSVGQWVTFSGDTTHKAYQITVITNATTLTVSPVILAAANGSGQIMTVQSYQSLAFHEYAIALALRPIFTPPEAKNVIDVMYMDLQGIPMRQSWCRISTSTRPSM